MLDFLVVDELPLVPHFLDGLNELHGIQVKDIFGRRMITEFLVVAGKAEHIANPQSIGPQDIALQGNPIPIPDHHL